MLTISASVCSSSVKSLVIQDLEKKFEELRDQVVYCFVNDTMTVVELGKYKDFLANQQHLADHGEFFYCGYNPPRKRHRNLDDPGDDLEAPTGSRARELARLRGLDDAGENLNSAPGPRAQELARLRAKSKGPRGRSPVPPFHRLLYAFRGRRRIGRSNGDVRFFVSRDLLR